MIILFPSDPLDPRQVDGMFRREAEAAKEVGLRTAMVSIDGEGQPFGMWGLPGADSLHPELTIYRGWMLKPDAYADMYRSALRNSALLINSPEEYLYCHELPRWYPDLKLHTPKSIWVEPVTTLGFELNDIVEQVTRKLGAGPYIVKDYVKSQKHYWKEACFIEGPEHIAQVTRHFLELQGDDLNTGLVFREFQPLKQVGSHPKSGTPISNEVRAFAARGHELMISPYWSPEEGGSDITLPRERLWSNWLSTIKSNFFTVDLAMTTDRNERWVVIELGDGQVSSLPEGADAHAFYTRLRERFDHPSV